MTTYLKSCWLWNVKRERNMQPEFEKEGRERRELQPSRPMERGKDVQWKEKEAGEKEGSRTSKSKHHTDFLSLQVQIKAHCASLPVSWGCESGNRGRMVERETKSRIIFVGKWRSFWLLSVSLVPDPYLEIFFLEKVGYAGGTHAVVPQLYPYLSSTRYWYGA